MGFVVLSKSCSMMDSASFGLLEGSKLVRGAWKKLWSFVSVVGRDDGYTVTGVDEITGILSV